MIESLKARVIVIIVVVFLATIYVLPQFCEYSIYLVVTKR